MVTEENFSWTDWDAYDWEQIFFKHSLLYKHSLFQIHKEQICFVVKSTFKDTVRKGKIFFSSSWSHLSSSELQKCMHLNLPIMKCCLRANSFHLWMFLLFSLCKHLVFYIPNTSAFKFVTNVQPQHRHSLNAHWTGWIQAPGMSKDDGLKHDSQPLLIGSWTPSFFLAYNASAVSRCIISVYVTGHQAQEV